ncbi:peptide/nickel transport system substrate-binding protein [Poseidonocella pacifica]|uniref:Peptide/nickel transport system substrate-binding protein n=1 Tax=Poseidonocella pacifica TaxID=871651 RepID=A0A1I0VV71_9RHOB|nr:peptide ABC transporter substrate-binding protein [Poseidonocella pacifica]SFA79576.1 peptide/nickel transport system substrate-binding protein [Poseidonocella pacifica]
MMPRSTLFAAAALWSLAPAVIAERGSDGHVNIIYWQAPSMMNPYLSGGSKENEAASLVIEPLGRFDQDGALVPFLAEEIPTLENGGVAEDLTSITWTLKQGLVWSDGSPVTSQDVKFTADYCMHPEGGCAKFAKFDGISSIDILDERSIKITFEQPTPYPYSAFIGAQTPIIQKAQFENCLGERAPECTEANFNPIGTGPFRVTDFRPNDVILMEANPQYRDPEKPAFATLTLKGGGDATAAGRAVMETGEFDYAWNLLLAPEVLGRMAEGGKGQPVAAFGTMIERIELNLTNPDPSLPPETRSTRAEPHPFLSDKSVRQALSMAIDRDLLVEIGFGQAGRPACNLVPAPAIYASDNTDCLVQDIEAARALLEDAGWTDTNGNGIRDKDGVELEILFQSSTNAVRQDFQALIKQWWSEIGVATELRNIDASVFFGGDPSSPDTLQKFYADVQMYVNTFDGTDPQAYLAMYRCGNEPRPETQWQGANINRYCDPRYDELLSELAAASDLKERGSIAKTLNDMLTKDSYVVVPLVDRGRVSAHSNTLGGVLLNPWDSELWNAADWYRIAD